MNMDEIQSQENQIALKHFTYEDAWILGNIIVDLARKNKLPVVISIEMNDQILFHCGFEGTSAHNDCSVANKRKVTKLFQKSSLMVREIIAESGKSIEESVHLSGLEYLAFGGCVPIRIVKQGMVATLTVSGLPDEDDHDLCIQGLKALMNQQ